MRHKTFIYLTEKVKFVLERVENILQKGDKCWLPAFSPFPKGLFLKVIKNGDCVIKS